MIQMQGWQASLIQQKKLLRLFSWYAPRLFSSNPQQTIIDEHFFRGPTHLSYLARSVAAKDVDAQNFWFF